MQNDYYRTASANFALREFASVGDRKFLRCDIKTPLNALKRKFVSAISALCTKCQKNRETEFTFFSERVENLNQKRIYCT